MKISKIILVLGLLLVFNCKSTKNYKYSDSAKKVEKEKSISESTLLQISMESVKYIPVETDTSETLENLIETEVIGLISNIPSYINQVLEKEKKKYTGTYKAKNSLSQQIKIDSPNIVLPELTLTRSFIKKGDITNNNAMKLVLKPHSMPSNRFAFIVDTLILNYSKAKLTKKYPFVNLLIEITATTVNNKNDKSTKKANPMVIPYKVGDNSWFKKADYTTYFSDTFSIKSIIEFEVQVTEINPKKVSLESLEKILTDNKNDLSKLFKAISDTLKE